MHQKGEFDSQLKYPQQNVTEKEFLLYGSPLTVTEVKVAGGMLVVVRVRGNTLLEYTI